MRREDLLEQFTYFRPDKTEIARMKDLQEGGLRLAMLIDERVADGPDKSAAIRKLRECVMTANRAIVQEQGR